MNIWKHKNWQTFKGTWLIASCVLSDTEIQTIIKTDLAKYGNFHDWLKDLTAAY